jgi:ABC-2 type transport system permease protein
VNLLVAIARVSQREFERIAARPILWGLLIIAPLVLFVILGGIYSRHVVTALPIAVCDQDHSELSRTLVRMLESTRSLKIVYTANSPAEIEEGIKAGRLQGGCVIPTGMESDLKTGKPTQVVIYKNTSNLIIGNLIYRDAATIIKTVSAGVLLKKFRSKGMSEEQAMGTIMPIRLDVYSLFNPGYNYANFLTATLLPVVLQMVLMLAVVMAINTEVIEGRDSDLFAIADGRPMAVLCGKELPYFLLGSAAMLGLLGIAFPILGIPIHGSVIATVSFSGLFVLAVVLTALLISAVVTDPQFATEIAVLLTTPAFLFSGETFPVRAMPGLYQAAAQILPSTHFLNGFIKLQLADAPLRYLWPETGALCLFAVLSGTVVWWRLRRRMSVTVAVLTPEVCA